MVSSDVLHEPQGSLRSHFNFNLSGITRMKIVGTLSWPTADILHKTPLKAQLDPPFWSQNSLITYLSSCPSGLNIILLLPVCSSKSGIMSWVCRHTSQATWYIWRQVTISGSIQTWALQLIYAMPTSRNDVQDRQWIVMISVQLGVFGAPRQVKDSVLFVLEARFHCPTCLCHSIDKLCRICRCYRQLSYGNIATMVHNRNKEGLV